MEQITHITVTAPEGRETPIHPSDGVQPGGAQLVVKYKAVERVAYSQSVRRAVARGDLIMCDMHGANVKTADQASAPRDLNEERVLAERLKNGDRK